ncbi:PD-(D/E)XK nuclease family protein [Algoriphagus sp. CAU 1675]|uniref:PD-(D/E)XK nuclease family protein n=1 Tax=Algoriphagus sp. CAU 1675 TaxID=3032597 RepID=UPI0023DB5B22|nr:PD-(D/E)XK nuclease family protein [Algoriphagus sp. CAU 1675]MDF2158481.1 PD-(D/E)XK nuclease family protein [Algoriphagus sp. CAU 1675]
MHSFLRNTAQSILESRQDMKDLVIVLPNRRAGLFFTRHLGNLIDQPLWMPEVRTIEQVFYGLAGQTPADELTLIFELYQVYRQLQDEPEDFDRFYFWGEIILKDFNDLDQFLADAKSVYRNLAEIKEFEADLSFLSVEQIELISQFWKSFERQNASEKEKFLRFWQILGRLYEQYQVHLKTSGLAYSGQLYREAVENLSKITQPEKHYIFVGFNAFTLAEEKLIKHFVKEFGAEIFWDVDAYYLEDVRQEAGLFFRDYQKDPVLGPTFPKEIPDKIRGKEGKIFTHSIPLKVNQANLVGKLAEVIGPEEALEESVIILPDEQLLFPTLHALPETVSKLNVTMGYPIRNAPIFAFLDSVLELQRYVKMKGDSTFFYHKPVTDLFTFPYLKDQDKDFVKDLQEEIKVSNLIEIPAEKLVKGGDLFALVFKRVEADELFEYLGGLMQTMASLLQEDPIQRSYLYQAFKQLTRIREVFSKNPLGKLKPDFFLKLFRQIFREVKLPFEGEPLEGLQIMGVLESRNLDFRRVIICDMNEGSFPPGGGINSMIPFNLRRAFKLPVQEQNDAIYAYTFYRLLHQAEEVHLIYTTASDGGKAGEMSRFIQQMVAELPISKPKPVLVPVSLTPGREIKMIKNESIFESLEKYLLKPDSTEKVQGLSASAINMYLDCRLKFYLRYVAGLKEKEEVVTEIDPMTFGTMLHKAIELLYSPEEGKEYREIDAHAIERLKPMIPTAVDNAIRDFYQVEDGEDLVLNGQLHIARAIFIKYLEAVLKYDQQNGTFRVLGLEKEFKAGIPIQTPWGEKRAALGGYIDRVDQKDGVIRLIDYKTGKDNKKIKSIASLFDREDKDRNKAAFQTMLYAYFYQSRHPENSLPLKPAIFNIKEIYDPKFSPFLTMDKADIENYFDFKEEFELGLSQLISEIFDPEVEFGQTEDIKKCEFCAYKKICGR